MVSGAVDLVLEPLGEARQRAVCADDMTVVQFAVVVEELVTASLIVFESGIDRYRLLEPLRQYALELLDGMGEVERWRERDAGCDHGDSVQSHRWAKVVVVRVEVGRVVVQRVRGVPVKYTKV
jgi:hypothetical protein